MKHLYTTLLVFVLFATQALAQVSAYQFNKGFSFTATTVADQKVVQTIMGTDQNINSVTTSVDTYELVSQTADTYTFSSSTSSITTKVSSPMGGQTMSSEGNGANAGLKAMTGKSFQFTISSKGEILSFSGLEEMAKAVEAELQGSPSAAMATELMTQITADAKRSTIGSLFPTYPADDAAEWSTEEDMVVNGAPTSTKTTYTRTDDGNLKSQSDIKVNGEISQMGMKANLNLSGLMNTDYTISPANGLPTSVSSVFDLAGFVMAQGMEIPMSISTKTTITIN